MRKLLPLIVLVSFFARLNAQPTAFAWPASPAQDQKEQNPCNTFAAVGAVETWYKILYPNLSPAAISKAHPYSRCGNANPASTTITDALTMFQNTGVVDYGTLPWASGSACSTGGGTDTYFGYNIMSGNMSALYNGDCGTPYVICVAGDGPPSTRYRIAGYSQLNIGQLTPTQLKLALMNDGPIALNMVDPLLHGATTHAYLLYGWNAQGYWLLTDSWPGTTSGLNQTKQNLDSLFAANADVSAYILQNSATYPGVWKQDYNSVSHTWTDDATTTKATTGCIYPAASNAFAITGASTVNATGSVYSVTGLSVLTSPTVTWSYETVTYNGSVQFSSSTGTSTTVTAASTGSVNVVASISRPNGLCEKIKFPVNVISTNIPFTLTQTENGCSGSTRFIQYQATSTYPLACSWTLHPPGTGGVTTITNGCTFTMDFTILPSSYGITMSVTSTALPGAADGYTTGGPAMACGRVMSFNGDSVSSASVAIGGDPNRLPWMVSSPQVTPNPASGIVTLRLPPSRTYEVKLLNTQGSVILAAKSATSSLGIDVSRLPNGIYFIQTRDTQTGEVTVRKVLVQK